jgi:hypothetical protein
MGDIIDITFRKRGMRRELHANLLKEFRHYLEIELSELLTDSVLAATWRSKPVVRIVQARTGDDARTD